MALASVEIGVTFCTIVIVTGPLWARPVWGSWWPWDPRLTTTLILWMLYFQGKLLPNNQLREKRILHAFKLAKPWHYGAFFLLRSPALLSAVVVYRIALGLFGVEASLISLLGYLDRKSVV